MSELRSHTVEVSAPCLSLMHFSARGTAITNFPREQEPLYRSAIERHGDPSLVISDATFPPCIQTDKSLHRLATPDDWKRRDLSEFWQVFDRCRQEAQSDEVSK